MKLKYFVYKCFYIILKLNVKTLVRSAEVLNNDSLGIHLYINILLNDIIVILSMKEVVQNNIRGVLM